MSESADIRWLSSLALRLYSSRNEEEMFAGLGEALHSRFRSIITFGEEIAYDYSTYAAPFLLGGWRPPPWYFAAVVDNPLAALIQNGQRNSTLHLRAHTSRRFLKHTNFYNLLLEPAGGRDQILATAQINARAMFCFTVNSDRPYAETDLTLVECARVHLAAALMRLRRMNAEIPQPTGANELSLGSNLLPLGMPPHVRTLLQRYFPGRSRDVLHNRLPDDLIRWARSCLVRLERSPATGPLMYYRTEAARGWLLVRFFPQQSGGTMLLRFTEELRRPDPFAQRAAGLTARECEILHWLSQGKRDSEIAVILGTSPRTIHKHVQRILVKTGVSSRVAVAVAAAQKLDTA